MNTDKILEQTNSADGEYIVWIVACDRGGFTLAVQDVEDYGITIMAHRPTIEGARKAARELAEVD
jgi:hypothetical protein